MNLLSDNWAVGRLPIANGIVFADGRIRPVVPIDAPRNLPLSFSIDQGAERILREEEIQGHAFFEKEEFAPDLRLKAVVGEGSWGGDGFVALFNTSDGEKLIWIASFDFSNPFVDASFEDAHLLVRNDLGENWRFPISGEGSILVVAGELYR